jgi:FMN phosphatase YigB (HAD superfamily)
MKIFIDFDDVMFNAKRFKNDLIKVFRKNGINRSEFENSYYAFAKKDQVRKIYYGPRKQINVLRRRGEIDRKKFTRDIDKFMEDLRGYVFPDCFGFISAFKKKDLYLITYGHEKFQLEKIKGARIKKFFKKVIISEKNKIDEILQTAKKEKFLLDENIVFIEDRPEQIEEAEKRKKSIKTFHMCRPEGRYSNLACKREDYEVKNLKEALNIVKKLKIHPVK